MSSRGSYPSRAHLILHVTTCDWYWNDLDWKSAKLLLQSCNPGTFLLRDSRSDSSVFSLSYKTPDKVLHSRADELLLKSARMNNTLTSPLDAFESLLQRPDLEMLVYQKDSVFQNIILSLTNPLRKRDCIPSLQFLARQVVVSNSKLLRAAQFLPKPIANYISESRCLNPPIEDCVRTLRQRYGIRNP